jgi:hypothetical protein
VLVLLRDCGLDADHLQIIREILGGYVENYRRRLQPEALASPDWNPQTEEFPELTRRRIQPPPDEPPQDE